MENHHHEIILHNAYTAEDFAQLRGFEVTDVYSLPIKTKRITDKGETVIDETAIIIDLLNRHGVSLTFHIIDGEVAISEPYIMEDDADTENE